MIEMMDHGVMLLPSSLRSSEVVAFQLIRRSQSKGKRSNQPTNSWLFSDHTYLDTKQSQSPQISGPRPIDA
jgi:hypothetical protein